MFSLVIALNSRAVPDLMKGDFAPAAETVAAVSDVIRSFLAAPINSVLFIGTN